MRTLVAGVLIALATATAAAPAHAITPAVGPRCSFLADPTDLRSDVAAFVVTAGPIHATRPGVRSVTVTCWVLTDGARAASVSHTDGTVGYAAGRTSVGTFTGPTVTGCTEIFWDGPSAGMLTDCPNDL